MWTLAIAVLLFNVGMSIFFFLYNLFMLDLGYREGPLGVLTGALALGSMVGTIPMGMAAQRVGSRNVLVVCLLLLAVAFGARVFLFWYPVQIAFAFLDGVLLCGWVVCLSPAVAAVVDERRRPAAFSLLFATAIIAGALGGLLGGNMPRWCSNLLSRSMGIAVSGVNAKRITLLASCVFTALAAVPIARLSRITAPLRREPVGWPARGSPFLVRFLLASALWAAAMGAFNPFTNVFFVRHVGLTTDHLGNFFGVAQLVQTAGVLLMPVLLRRAGFVPAISAAQIGSATALVLLAWAHGILAGEALYCMFMFAQHMCDPAFQNLLMDGVAEDQRNPAAALNYLVTSLGQAVAALCAGTAFQEFGYPPVLITIAVGCLGSAFALRTLLRGWHKSAGVPLT